jgi:hypothetical protein
VAVLCDEEQQGLRDAGELTGRRRMEGFGGDMIRTIAVLAAWGLLAGAAQAAAPSAAQKATFLDVCVKTSQNEPLCTCKADAAMTLVDADFMDVILASMSGKTLDPKYNVAYNDYIVESTRACGMGM